MQEFSGQLIQNETGYQETGDSELSQLHATKTEKEEVAEDSGWFSWLAKVSIGQYRTPLYY
jgi:hypothetical protein